MDLEDDEYREGYGKFPAIAGIAIDDCILLYNTHGVATPVSGDHTTNLYKKETTA